jgi:hypothetical protein
LVEGKKVTDDGRQVMTKAHVAFDKVDRGFEHRSGQTKDYNIGFLSSLVFRRLLPFYILIFSSETA